MADIRRVKLPNGTTYNIKDNTARSNINNIVNGTTKLPYGKSLSITNNTISLLDPNNNSLSTISLFKQAHFEYLDAPMSLSVVTIDEVEPLAVGDLVYIRQLSEYAIISADALFCKSDTESHVFYINSGVNKADPGTNYVYSISTRYDYIAKVLNDRGNGLYDFEIIAGGPKDDLMHMYDLYLQQDRTNLIPSLGQITLSFWENTDYTNAYLQLYDENDNVIIPAKESIGILANGKVLLQYTCSTAVAKIKTYSDVANNYMPNFVAGFAYVDGLYEASCNILYTNNNSNAEGTFVSGSLQNVYESGASSWDLLFVCDYEYTKIF